MEATTLGFVKWGGIRHIKMSVGGRLSKQRKVCEQSWWERYLETVLCPNEGYASGKELE